MPDTTTEFVPATIVADKPSSSDEFPGRGHQRSGAALSDAIGGSNSKHTIIGLEGEWGSGKSTVINIAQAQLEDQGNGEGTTPVLCFDLWSYKSDRIKRGLIEELLAWSTLHKFLNKEEADAFSKRVSQKHIQTRIENTREYKITTSLFFIVLTLLPLAYMWLSPFAFSIKEEAGSLLLPALRWLAVLIVLTILALFLIAFLGAKRKQKNTSARAALSAAVRLFTKESDYDKLDQYIDENAMDGEHFQRLLSDIVTIIAPKCPQLVLVFDNIDRLPYAEILHVWADVRSIVSSYAKAGDAAPAKLTALIPYDRKHLATSYRDQIGAEKDGQAEAQRLVEKTFDVIVRVAPPISTDWRSFLERTIDRVFPHSIAPNERYRLFKLLDLDNKTNSSFPTPRRIISYTNEIALLWNQWKGIHSLSHIALFVLLRPALESSTDLIGEDFGVSPEQRRAMGEGDWVKSLASLFYNVEPKHAYEVWIGPDIEHALTAKLDEFIEASNKQGFSEALPEVVHRQAENWARDGGYELASAVKNLNDSGIEGAHIEECWSSIVAAVDSLNGGAIEHAEHLSLLSSVIDRCSENAAWDKGQKLSNWALSILPEEHELSEKDGGYWMNFYSSIHTALFNRLSTSYADSFLTCTKLPKSSDFIIGACAASADCSGLDFNKLSNSVAQSDLKAAAEKKASTSPRMLHQLVSVNASFLDKDTVSNAVDAICSTLHSNKPKASLRTEFFAYLCRFIVEAQDRTPLLDKVATRVSDGTLAFHYLQAANSEQVDSKTLGRILWLTMEATKGEYLPPNLGSHSHFGDLSGVRESVDSHVTNSAEDVELASIIGTLISSTSELKKWSEWACDPDKPKLVTEAFRQYISMGISGALPVDYIISNFSKLQALLDDELCQKFLIRFGDWSKFYGQYFEGENCLKIDPNIVYAIDKIGSEGLQNLFLLVDAHFNGLDREAWLTTLSEESEALKLLFARIKTGYKPLAPYREALMQHILDTLDGNTSISGRHQQWETVLEGVAKNTRQKLAQDVMLDLKNITTNPESVEHFVSVYNEFSRSLPLDSNPDDALDQIITPLVSSKSDPAKAYFQDLEKVMVDCVKKAGSDACGRLQEAVDVLIGSGDEASSGWAIELCEQFGFPRSKLEELVSTDESQEEDENN